MNDSDKRDFAEIMYGLADNFRESITKDGLRFRFAAMREYDIDQVRNAAIRVIRGRKYTKFPTTGEIISEIEATGGTSLEFRAMEAWARVLDHVRSGQWRYRGTGDASIDGTVRMMGGWPRMGEMLTSEIPFREREFTEKFGLTADSAGRIEGPVADSVAGLLAGIGG